MKLLIATGLLLMVTGCSHLMMVKDCKLSEQKTRSGDLISNCRMIKPWE